MRLSYGLERLPIGVASERLPGVVLGPHALRLNSEPMPPSFFPQADDHALRVTALRDWLYAACGDYAPLRRRFITLYLDFVAAHLEPHREALHDRLRRFEGLYRPEDFFWSALRPLPRAWIPVKDGTLMADIAFWDSEQIVAVMIGEERSESDAMLAAAGASVHRIAPSDLNAEAERVVLRTLPENFQEFWKDEVLPMTPFRRAIEVT